MIVDTSVLIAMLRGEAGAERLRDKLLVARDLRISAGNVIEARMVAERDSGGQRLTELLATFSIDVIAVDARQVELAHEGFRRFGKGRHPAGLNFGDLFAYALARAYDEPLLYVGTDFGLTDVRSVIG